MLEARHLEFELGVPLSECGQLALALELGFGERCERVQERGKKVAIAIARRQRGHIPLGHRALIGRPSGEAGTVRKVDDTCVN